MSTSSPNIKHLLIGVGILFSLLLLFFGYERTSSSPSLPRLTDHVLAPLRSSRLDDTLNATLGFQKIFVINMPSRTDRRDSMALAAAFSNLQVEYIEGVTEVDDDVIPPGGKEANLDTGSLHAWRAHMNAIRTVIDQNLTSALILEDDADWDLRIKSQMHDFAKASRMLVQPLPGTTDEWLDPTMPEPLPTDRWEDMALTSDATSPPYTSPYGDIHNWDLLWLGHCGARFPGPRGGTIPLGRVIIAEDETVPEPQHIGMQFWDQELIKKYPAHTRVVSRARHNVCTLAYGISQHGARRFLYELGVKKLSANTDLMFRQICDGTEGRPMGTCLTVQPQLFQHHRPIGDKASFSDITEHDGGYNEMAFTRNVRWSVRLNFPMLVNGSTDYIDLYRDGEEANPNLGFG